MVMPPAAAQPALAARLGLMQMKMDDLLGQVAEGLWTVDRLLERSRAEGVELPICAEVSAAVSGKPVRECMVDLMTRAPASEG